MSIAACAAVSTRTVDNYFCGASIRENTRIHIERALRELQLEHFMRSAVASNADTNA